MWFQGPRLVIQLLSVRDPPGLLFDEKARRKLDV